MKKLVAVALEQFDLLRRLRTLRAVESGHEPPVVLTGTGARPFPPAVLEGSFRSPTEGSDSFDVF